MAICVTSDPLANRFSRDLRSRENLLLQNLQPETGLMQSPVTLFERLVHFQAGLFDGFETRATEGRPGFEQNPAGAQRQVANDAG